MKLLILDYSSGVFFFLDFMVFESSDWWWEEQAKEVEKEHWNIRGQKILLCNSWGTLAISKRNPVQ